MPGWGAAARAATGGRGVDIVVETAGGTLSQALSAVAFGGFVGVIGFVGGYRAEVDVARLGFSIEAMVSVRVHAAARHELRDFAKRLLRVPVVDVSLHLPWLVGVLGGHGVRIEERRLDALEQADPWGDAVVDCTGLGAAEPVNDAVNAHGAERIGMEFPVQVEPGSVGKKVTGDGKWVYATSSWRVSRSP